MSKNEQIVINAIVKQVFDNLPHIGLNVNSIRLYHCNAYIYYVGRYVILRSYNTIIAVYDGERSILYDGLRYVYGYTATSAQHIAKFKRVLPDKPEQILTYRNI